MIKTYEAEILLNNFLMNNCTLADPLHPLKKEMSAYSGKRKKTDEDHKAMAALEFKSKLYLNMKGTKPVIPARSIEAFILASAKVHKEGKLAVSGIFVDSSPEFTYEGGPLSMDDLMDSPAHRLVIPVTVARARLMRTRPYFENVQFKVTISANADIVTEFNLQNWLQTGVNQVGIGDYRPRYGRGSLLSFKQLK